VALRPRRVGRMVLENPRPEDLRRSLDALAAWRRSHLRGDEKGEAQIFLDWLFRAYGHEGLREAGAMLQLREWRCRG
jgi:hypothetical protein